MCERLALQVEAKRKELAGLRETVSSDAIKSLENHQRIDITFASNAIEGNTLTAGETALVLEKGITVAGKPLKDHLEAVDHAKALDWVLDLARTEKAAPSESDIRNLHRLVVETSNPDIAGRYADRARLVNTGTGNHTFPSPSELPALMADFVRWLGAAKPGAQTAFDAHRKFVAIHPFNDGNGRTARLLMNLFLARAGFPPIAIRPDDRPRYIANLEIDQSGGGQADFDQLMFERLDATLDFYLKTLVQARRARGRNAT